VRSALRVDNISLTQLARQASCYGDVCALRKRFAATVAAVLFQVLHEKFKIPIKSF
jgi:hypothetical protein